MEENTAMRNILTINTLKLGLLHVKRIGYVYKTLYQLPHF